MKQHDPVEHPSHYGDGTYEVIKVHAAWLSAEEFRGYCLGNVLKYVARSGKKGDRLEDLRKARWYLDRAIEGEM